MLYQDVENILKQLGLNEVSRTKRAIGFSKGSSVASAYINSETKTARNTLILHPDYESQLSSLTRINGVYQGRSN